VQSGVQAGGFTPCRGQRLDVHRIYQNDWRQHGHIQSEDAAASPHVSPHSLARTCTRVREGGRGGGGAGGKGVAEKTRTSWSWYARTLAYACTRLVFDRGTLANAFSSSWPITLRRCIRHIINSGFSGQGVECRV
jgi:hypothetical protein